MGRGRMFVLEGGDAVGKATQAKMLVERLNATKQGSDQWLTDPPPAKLYSFPRYETPLGQAILRHLKGEISVRRAEHADVEGFGRITVYPEAPEDAMIFQCMTTIDKYHAAEEIQAQLDRGGHVVCDRWLQSAFVFGSVDGLDPTWLMQIHNRLPSGGLNFLLDLPADAAGARRPEARDRYEKNADHRQKVHAKYREVWDRMQVPEGRLGVTNYHIIDASQTIAEVHAQIWAHVALLFQWEAGG